VHTGGSRAELYLKIDATSEMTRTSRCDGGVPIADGDGNGEANGDCDVLVEATPETLVIDVDDAIGATVAAVVVVVVVVAVVVVAAAVVGVAAEAMTVFEVEAVAAVRDDDVADIDAATVDNTAVVPDPDDDGGNGADDADGNDDGDAAAATRRLRIQVESTDPNSFSNGDISRPSLTSTANAISASGVTCASSESATKNSAPPRTISLLLWRCNVLVCSGGGVITHQLVANAKCWHCFLEAMPPKHDRPVHESIQPHFHALGL
jgi:hypothetical protein